ncbi:MAG: M48 family metallopeptidase [Rhodospirillales bacterium]|nr:M48 family metallopeptidase [Rhodospirillales bacterium]
MRIISRLRRERIAVASASLTLADRTLPVTVRCNPRARRMILRIAPCSGAVVITVPSGVSVDDGVAFARSKSEWLRSRLGALPRRIPFAPGAEIPLQGVPHRIRHDPAQPRRAVNAAGGEIVVGGTLGRLSDQVHAWLRNRAREALAPRVEGAAARIGRRPGRIAIRDQRTRWGSCAANGNLSFNWRLIMAPPVVLDYVVAHELAHLVERGHGPAFWRVVETLTPEARNARQWLSQHGSGLMLYG